MTFSTMQNYNENLMKNAIQRAKINIHQSKEFKEFEIIPEFNTEKYSIHKQEN